jgi:hypothetical protein
MYLNGNPKVSLCGSDLREAYGSSDYCAAFFSLVAISKGSQGPQKCSMLNSGENLVKCRTPPDPTKHLPDCTIG